MKKVLLVNATSYNAVIPDDARILKEMYFRVKAYAKKRKIRGLNLELNRNTRTYAVGLLRIATILKYNGYEVRYIDLDELCLESLGSTIQKIDIIAFSAVTPTVPKCAELCSTIKAMNPDIMVAIGGAHINVAKEMTKQRYPCFDIFADGYDMEGASQIVCVPACSLKAPKIYADYSLLPYPLTEYILNTFTTLGCMYGCDYCQDHMVKYYENPDITGLTHFLGNVPRGSMIHYFDSSIGVKQERTKAVCKALSRLDHGFLLSCDARAEAITPEVVRMLEDAGFVEISMGMEIADSGILKGNNRYLPYSKLEKAFDIIRNNSNIYISIYNAIGIPGSTVEATTASRNILRQLLLSDCIDEMKSCIYVPYPMDNKDYQKRGVTIENQDWSKYDRQSFPVYRLENMTAQEIWEEATELLRTSVFTWVEKFGFRSINDMPNEYWIEYISKSDNLVH